MYIVLIWVIDVCGFHPHAHPTLLSLECIPSWDEYHGLSQLV